jgi:molybdopterin-guanine dinucleotide biosynthesis adapter protein
LIEKGSVLCGTNATPTVSIVGRSSKARTDVIEKLIPRFKSGGYRIAIAKHDVHGFEIDQEGKSTWRYGQAGSDVVIISNPIKMALIRQTKAELNLTEIEAYVRGTVDVLITDGYLKSDKPKIEVAVGPVSEALLSSVPDLIAVVSNCSREFGVPRFAPNDIGGLADFIISRFLVKQ